MAARCLRRNSQPSLRLAALLLLGVGLRLLQIKAVAVGNLLPALLVAPAGLDSGAIQITIRA